MSSVGVRELKARTSEILRRVREQDEVVEITYRGRVVARIVPAERRRGPDPEELEAIWAERDRLAEEIAKHWPEGVSAVDAIREDRREL